MSFEENPACGEFQDELFFIDTAGKDAPVHSELPGVKTGESVWHDEDDEHVRVSLVHDNKLRKLRTSEADVTVSASEYVSRLRSLRTERFMKTPKWAESARKSAEERGSEDAEDEAQEGYIPGLLDRVAQGSAASDVLLPDFLAINKKLSFKVPSSSSSFLETVEYHPTSASASVIMASGMDKSLQLFKVEGASSERIFSAKFADMPVSRSHFSTNGNEIMAIGRRPFFYSMDVPTQQVTRITGVKGRHETEWSDFCYSPCGKFIFMCGADGNIVVLTATTKQWVSNLKMNENVVSLCVSPDSRHLFSVGSANGIYIWDLTAFRCIKRFVDDGGTSGTAISVSPDMSLLACGSVSGIVNVYDLQALLTSKPHAQPQVLKSYGNLVHPVTNINFHPSSQILSFFSREKRNALRMAHYPSGRVYSNWPTERSPLGRVTSVSYSPRGDSAAFASKDGSVQIYNLKHFAHALEN